MLLVVLKRIFNLQIPKLILVSCAGFLMVGCKTPGFYIENSNLPVSESRKAIAAVIGKPRIMSLNGRELTSYYHDKKFEFLDFDKTYKTRYYTKVIVLGPRRPYEISVQVHKEVLDPQTQVHVDTGLDEEMTQQRAGEIKRSLNKSLENYQTIDGENPF